MTGLTDPGCGRRWMRFLNFLLGSHGVPQGIKENRSPFPNFRNMSQKMFGPHHDWRSRIHAADMASNAVASSSRAPDTTSSSCSSSTGSDGGYSDWEDDVEQKTQSLFDKTIHPSPEAAFEHDASVHQFDLCEKARTLDTYQMMRFINLVRREVSLHVPSQAHY